MSKKDMNENQEILEELKRIARILTLIATKNLKPKEQIKILSSLDFQPREISELSGIPSGTVRSTLHRMKQNQKRKGAKKKEDKS